MPDDSLDTQLQSLSETTIKQYNTAYKFWWRYCQERNIHVYKATIPQVLTFFQYLLENKKFAYGSFNSFRAALALISLEDIGTEARVKRFFKGVRRLKPPGCRFNTTWDPQVVLDFLASLYPNKNLNLESLTKKVCTLLALITAHRIQTLVRIRVENIIITSEEIKIYITDDIKTTMKNNTRPVLHIPFFTQQPQICPASALITYIELTAPIRTSEQEFLLLTTRKPHLTASTQTVSRWIRQTLRKAGIDTQMFSGYSTRHAATSAAFKNGVTLEVIRRTAGWTENSAVFAKFYNKPVIDNAYFARSFIK